MCYRPSIAHDCRITSARRPRSASLEMVEASVEAAVPLGMAADGMVEVNIVKLVKVWLKKHPWPEEPMRLGPGSCGDGCRKQHAYAYAVGRDWDIGPNPRTYYIFVHDRPCNYHESAWDRQMRRKTGLPEVRDERP